MKVLLIDDQGKQTYPSFILRLPGWTEEEYFKSAPKEGKCEFVKGDLIVMTPMSGDHSDLVLFLGSLLRNYCDAKDLGVTLPGPTIRLESEVHREPDICFIPKKWSHLTSGMPLEVIPPFIIEVSCSTRSMDLGEKALDYERAGVAEYWVVDMEKDEMVVHLLEGKKYNKTIQKLGQLESTVVEGFAIPLDWLWQKPLPSAFQCLKKLLNF